jgi:hypothetical protein
MAPLRPPPSPRPRRSPYLCGLCAQCYRGELTLARSNAGLAGDHDHPCAVASKKVWCSQEWGGLRVPAEGPDRDPTAGALSIRERRRR